MDYSMQNIDLWESMYENPPCEDDLDGEYEDELLDDEIDDRIMARMGMVF